MIKIPRRTNQDVVFDISAGLEHLHDKLGTCGMLDRADFLFTEKKAWEHIDTKKLFATDRELKRITKSIKKIINLLYPYV